MSGKDDIRYDIAINRTSQQKRIASRRLPTIRSGITVIWIEDPNISSDLSNVFTERIRAIKHCLIIRFKSIMRGIRYLKKSRSYERVILILIMKHIEYATINRLKSYQQTQSILIVSSEEMNDKSMVTGKDGRVQRFLTCEMMFMKLETLLNEPQPYDDGLFIAVNQKEKSLRNVHQALGPFIWSQAFKG